MSAVVVLFMFGFAVMTDCTNNFSCGTDGCDPCSAANAWFNGGYALVGLSFLSALGVLVAHARGITSMAVRVTAMGCLVMPVLAIAGAVVAAPRSYCNDPNERAVDGGPNYCDT